MEEIIGGVRFCVSVKASDMADWPAERIAGFFDGLAMMLRARAGLRQESFCVCGHAESEHANAGQGRSYRPCENGECESCCTDFSPIHSAVDGWLEAGDRLMRQKRTA